MLSDLKKSRLVCDAFLNKLKWARSGPRKIGDGFVVGKICFGSIICCLNLNDISRGQVVIQ